MTAIFLQETQEMRIATACLLTVVVLAGLTSRPALAQCAKNQKVGHNSTHLTGNAPQLVWVDTDIGDDIDDAFAIGLLLTDPSVKILGISTAFGNTELRARILDRFLAASSEGSHNREPIPVTAGVHTETDNVMTQAAYASESPAKTYPDGVAALLNAIREHPGQITLIAIGPLFNIGAAIDRDPQTFRKLRRIVMMGGSVYRGYDSQTGTTRPPDPEWNIKQDPKGASKLLASAVPIFMMPLDSTMIHFQSADRDSVFASSSPLATQLKLLYTEWVANTDNHSPTPTLFDPVAVAYAIQPRICPMQPMSLKVDEKGFTLPTPGKPNVQVCLKSDGKAFMTMLLDHLEARVDAVCSLPQPNLAPELLRSPGGRVFLSIAAGTR